MSFLFGKQDVPAPVAMPVAPGVGDEAARQRQAAADAALADSKLRGRRSTIVAGMQIAADERRERAAAKVLGD